MAIFRFRAQTARPASDVVAYFADMRHAPEWDPSISAVERLDDGPVQEGSAFRVTLGFLGRSQDLVYRVAELEPGRRLVLRSEATLFVSEDTVTVTAHDDGPNTVSYEARLSGRGVAALADPLFWLMIRHFGRRAGDGLMRGFLR